VAGLKKVQVAKGKGIAILNHGAGTMPVDAPAPFGGERYSLLVDPPGTSAPTWGAPHGGQRDPSTGKLVFEDFPEFTPLLTPPECVREGIFGGCYFNSRGGKIGIFGREVEIDPSEFPPSWFEGVSEHLYTSRRYNVPTNKFKVKAGQDQAFWESKGWIHQLDPRGWFQWYCRFYMGRRCADDKRQVKRWAACAGASGRWRNQLCGKVRSAGVRHDDARVSPVIRQTLLHWAYELTEEDYAAWKSRQK